MLKVSQFLSKAHLVNCCFANRLQNCMFLPAALPAKSVEAVLTCVIHIIIISSDDGEFEQQMMSGSDSTQFKVENKGVFWGFPVDF